MNSPAITLREPPRGRSFGAAGFILMGGFEVVSPH